MTIDVILYWVAFGLVMTGMAITYTHWWDRGYMLLALGMAVLGTACLFRGYWPDDAALAAFSYVSGLGITYIAFRKERKHGESEVGEGQADGQLSEGAGDRP